VPPRLKGRAALNQQLSHGLPAMGRRDMKGRLSDSPSGLDARGPGIKAKIQHEPHSRGVARAGEISKEAQVL
jgi:hypothetical protein